MEWEEGWKPSYHLPTTYSPGPGGGYLLPVSLEWVGETITCHRLRTVTPHTPHICLGQDSPATTHTPTPPPHPSDSGTGACLLLNSVGEKEEGR